MPKKLDNHFLLLEIAIADQRTDELMEKARDVFVMHNTNCSMLRNLSFWMDLVDEKVLDFLETVLETIPLIEEDYFEIWAAMDIFEQVEFILGNDQPQEIAWNCTTFKFR